MIGSLISGGLGLLGSLFGGNDAGSAIMDAVGQNRNLLSDFNLNANFGINRGEDEARGYLQRANDQYDSLAKLGTQGGQLYADAMGINGADGAARATGAFQTGPGYQFAMDQGLQALERRAASQGRLQSGQTGLDTVKYATGLADQTWGSWLDRLGSPSNPLNTAMSANTNILGSLAGLSTSSADKRANLQGTVASGLMDLNNQFADAKERQYAEGQQKQAGIFGSLGKLGGSLAGYM